MSFRDFAKKFVKLNHPPVIAEYARSTVHLRVPDRFRRGDILKLYGCHYVIWQNNADGTVGAHQQYSGWYNHWEQDPANNEPERWAYSILNPVQCEYVGTTRYDG